ncbi:MULTISPECIES: NADH-quinone oxidoreductase subunit NuoN [unclassified Sphingopyxis]|jgi:NADH-quinone oxidoreductase subunit N|uniref:NADH-quinone oxidoreductase subunit NuoN n=1 Tax=unclassified Sphingopyxis TaxID=2614943 RepID=UPI00073127B9|nr:MULTISPECIES: NADH-quinone oxidoreductase subunit NuoN [unclassified Sphingopyxis]KTE03002.1 NADH-quinone oxidoreductase subunit N [Sphingopyxis sp. H012]KTE10379.1 NADH-quinone oxidoreductase subunit N [Sphingopyxis sp. H053]KTE14694.1 NADH-quinone oxidoreductase subunit N [Sphingopyxis sp. H093]KTE28985.1 NADH-quinone oxidoreductase subunit N [Sphingopyxis sp. H080]KTE35983.1 NADH-quinone oxidoreductase subunit N [Sphingopyxis sp. H038]
MTADLMLIWPELILTIGGLITLMLGTFFGDRNVGLYQLSSLLTLAAAAAAVVALFGVDATVFSGTLSVDSFGGFAKLLIYAASFVCIVIAPRFFNGGMRAEYPTLILFAALGMGIMASSRDLMTLYVGLELNSLAAYVLASFMRTDERSTEAGLKYFVLGALASGMLLYGISLLYGFTGTTDFAGIAKVLGGELNIGLIFGIVFVLAGLGFKISAVPFHMWTPDVYEGAPTPVTTFFATAPKVAAMALMTRVVIDAMGPAVGAWQQIIIFLSLASIILGAVGAIGQKNIKRLLAYSSINNVGFMLVGLAAGTQQGVEGVLTYLLVYMLTTLGAFLVVLQLRDADGNHVESIPALAGLSQRRPGLAAAMAVFLFSLAGIPPLFGFWPKYLVFEAAVNANLVPLAVAGIVASVIGAFYYIAIIKTMYFDDKSDTEFPAGGGAIVEDAVITASALWLSVIGYLFIPVLAVLSASAAAVLF